MEATVKQAIQKINYFDFYWRMADSDFNGNYRRAKAAMKSFVNLVATISCRETRQALRQLWVLEYEKASASIHGESTKSYTEKEQSLLAKLS